MKYTYRFVLFISIFIFSPGSYASDLFNIKTAPITDIIGISNIEVDIKVSEHFTLGPSYSGFNYEFSDVDLDGNFFGVRANYYFNEALSGGWLIGMSAIFGDFTISETNAGIEYSTTTNTRIISALFSYQAMWDHFNLTFGLGASYFSLPKTVTAASGVNLFDIDTSFISGIVPNAELTVGWRF